MLENKTIWDVETYIQHELQAERRHEFINGELFEMQGQSDVENQVVGSFAFLLSSQLRKKGYQIYIIDIKISIPNESKYYYPDVFVTSETQIETNEYIKYQPEIIVEVLSKSTRIRDTVDKYVDYTKIPSLKYYLVAEPETIYVKLYFKNAEGSWAVDIFSNLNAIISMPLLGIEMPLKEIYNI